MLDIHPSDKAIGRTLWNNGWRQGSLFYAPSSSLVWNARSDDKVDGILTVKQRRLADIVGDESELLIVATQDCDIVADTDKEPFIEALLCTVEIDEGRLKGLDKNSARWFVVNLETHIMANAMDRLLFSKFSLISLTPIPWPSTAGRFQRYVDWLARRFDRPAIPDVLVSNFQKPVIDVFESLKKKQPQIIAAFNRAVHSMRIKLPTRSKPPYDVHVVLLARDESLTAEEDDAIRTVMSAIRAKLDSAQIALVRNPWIVSPERISLADYQRTRPLPLEYFSFQGETFVGANPVPRT